MSKQHFLSYINLLVANSPYNKTILAERARVSRQALHKLLSGEVEEAKLSTMINVAYALDVHPIELIRRFFLPPNVTIPDSRQQTADSDHYHLVQPDIQPKKRRSKVNDARFVTDLSYPDNSRVMMGEQFVKTWRLTNTGDLPWLGCKLVCQDELSRYPGLPAGLVPDVDIIPISDTDAGDSVSISIRFTAPSLPSCVVSYWKLVDAEGKDLLNDTMLLHCLVQVIAL
jgi:DNA-binding Xre family transcriptional regulator